MIQDNDDEPRGPLALMGKHSGVIVGGVGLVGWFALLWFMFGDVL